MIIVCFGGNGTLGKELQKIDGKMFCPPSSAVNIENKEDVKEFIKTYKPDVVINAAAIIDNRILEKIPEKAISTNIIGAANVANVCIEENIRYIYISTDYIYRGNRGNYSEEDDIFPFNFYSWTKLGGEASAKGVKNHLIIRVSFGKSDFSYPVAFIDKWSSKDYVDKIAPLIYEAAISPLTGIINIGTERKTLFSHAKERNKAVKPVKLSETNFFTPYDTSLNLQKWINYKSEKSVCNAHTRCRACESTKLVKYLDLGLMPLSNNLEMTSLAAKMANRYPLQVMFCENCGLSQLSVVIDPGTMFSNYVYRSSVNKPYIDHCRKMAKALKEEYNLNKNSFHIDIAGNDGTLLKEFKEEIGLKVLNVDPASNLAAIAEAQGIPTIADFWSPDVGEEIYEKYGLADLITATNVFAHVNDIREFLVTADHLLKPNGIIVIECPYIMDYLEKMEYNQTYFEHLSYMSLSPLWELCNKIHMMVIDVEKCDIHGGTMRVVIAKDPSTYYPKGSITSHIPKDSVVKWLSEEKNKGYTSFKLYSSWSDKVKKNLAEATENILKLKKEGKSIVGLGASAKGNTLLNALGFTTDIIDAIIDETSEKIGKFSPGTGIPIVHKRYFVKNKPDYVIILAENFKEPLMKKAREAGYEGNFITCIPTFQIKKMECSNQKRR